MVKRMLNLESSRAVWFRGWDIAISFQSLFFSWSTFHWQHHSQDTLFTRLPPAALDWRLISVATSVERGHFSLKVLKKNLLAWCSFAFIYWAMQWAHPWINCHHHGNRLLLLLAKLYHLEPGVASAPDKSLRVEEERFPQRNTGCCDQKKEDLFFTVYHFV